MTFEPPIRPAAVEDLDALAAMRAAEGWLINRDLLDLLQHAPRARLFVIPSESPPPNTPGFAHADTPPAGVPSAAPPLAAVSAVAYGPIGFIGNVIVAPHGRGQGHGKRVMRAALAWLRAAGVRRVELDATPEGRPLYERLGFVATERSWIVEGAAATLDTNRLAALASASTGPIAALHSDALGSVAALDRAALGGDRLDLLGALLATPQVRAWVALGADDRAEGYLVARPMAFPHVGLHLGPWVCRGPEVAAALLTRLLAGGAAGAEAAVAPTTWLHAVLPGAARAGLGFARQVGLTPVPDDMRMRLELPPVGVAGAANELVAADMNLVYAMLAPMVG